MTQHEHERQYYRIEVAVRLSVGVPLRVVSR